MADDGKDPRRLPPGHARTGASNPPHGCIVPSGAACRLRHQEVEQLGYAFAGNDWMHPTNNVAPAPAITDVLQALLVKRTDELEGCTEGSDEERELEAITNQIQAYEAVCWPLGRTQDGTG